MSKPSAASRATENLAALVNTHENSTHAKPIAHPASTPDTGGSSWTIGQDIAPYLAEAFVADYLFASDHRTRWRGGNNRGCDVYSGFPEGMTEADIKTRAQLEQAQVSVDAKHAYLKDVLLAPGSPSVPGISLFCAARVKDGIVQPFARDEVSHFGLVVLDLTKKAVAGNHVSVDGGTVTINATHTLAALYLVPREVINDTQVFNRKLNKKGERKGLELVAPLDRIQDYLVADRNGPLDKAYPIPGR